MIRSALSRKMLGSKIAITITAILAVVIVLAINALRPQMPAGPVPVTGQQAGPAAAIQQLDLGAGYTLITNANGTHIVAPEAAVKSVPASQTLDLGAGYVLRDGQIIAPSRPDTAVRRMDLGAGYTLVTNAGNSQIVAPASSLKPASGTSQTLDLGAGYTLRDGQIVAPASNLKASPATSQKIDLGGGYWLVLTGSEGQIVSEGSRNR